jgi:glycosyltransferase involved in cell wall biosynthesis
MSVRIGFVSTWQTACGIAAYTEHLAGALAGSGLESEVFEIDRAADRFLTRQELVERFRNLVPRGQRLDLVHVQHEFGLFAGAYGYEQSLDSFAALCAGVRSLGLPLVVTFHSEPFHFEVPGRPWPYIALGMGRRLRWRTQVARELRRSGATAVVHTRTTRRKLIDSGVPADQVRVIPHGVDRPAGGRVEPPRPQDREAIGLPGDATVLGIAGFVSRYKGYDTALRALRVLPADHHLLVLGGQHPQGGDDALDQVLRWSRSKRPLRDRVHVSGSLEPAELRRRQRAVDLQLAPFLRWPELSSSGSITWGLSSGRPVIASAIPAFAELNEQWDCLELVMPEAPHELAMRVETLMASPDRRSQLIANAARYVEANSWATVAQTHTDLYQEILTGGAGRRPRLAHPR